MHRPATPGEVSTHRAAIHRRQQGQGGASHGHLQDDLAARDSLAACWPRAPVAVAEPGDPKVLDPENDACKACEKVHAQKSKHMPNSIETLGS